jgi:hypothetical protein
MSKFWAAAGSDESSDESSSSDDSSSSGDSSVGGGKGGGGDNKWVMESDSGTYLFIYSQSVNQHKRVLLFQFFLVAGCWMWALNSMQK